NGTGGSGQSKTESTAAPETAEETGPARPDLLTWQEPWQQALAGVLNEKLKDLGRPHVVNDSIARIEGTGIVHMQDLDKDGEEELLIVYAEKTAEGYNDYVFEIWKGHGGKAERLFAGLPYRAGVDNQGIALWEDEKGSIFFRYDTKDTMNGKFLGTIEEGAFREAFEIDWSQFSYDTEKSVYLYGGHEYRETGNFMVNCYYPADSPAYQDWLAELMDSYRGALTSTGLSKEEGAVVYSPGLTSLLDDKYLKIRVTHTNAAGNVTAIWEYEYDEAGRETRTYRNDILRTETLFHSDGTPAREVSYRSNGLKSEESLYDGRGNLLEKITYTDNGRENWHYIYTYDEKGRMATATMGIGGLKEYYYNDDDVLIEAKTVDPDTGAVENTHTFVLDEQGRPVEEYLNSGGRHLKYKTWEYRSDGTHSETLWDYKHYDEHVNWVYLEGNEKPGTVTEFDAEGREILVSVYAFKDFGKTEQVLYTTEETVYDEDGNILTKTVITRNEGVPSYEEKTENEWTADGQLKKRVMTYHNYGYWAHLGETEHELSFTDYESDFNEAGYRVHVKTWKCADPYTNTADDVYMNDEMFILYENAYGDLMGMDY
ncbi:MAG: RHS repeat protein, partial [Lachnospiraceae bacterium]|nr:RHS repeat protein [Lachnospiraceae bacterium]